MADFWKTQRVAVTGGAGFLGSHVVARLKDRGCPGIFVPVFPEYDLTQPGDVRRMYDTARPTLVLHLAAVVGGLGAHRANPGSFFYRNLMMGLLLMEEARLRDVSKFVGIGSSGAYPKVTCVPFKEEDLWNGYPDEILAPYAMAKKMLLVQAVAYRRQYGFNAIHLMPVNLYGARDHFDLPNAHVVPALIRRCLDARDAAHPFLEVWGTGEATREFLYAADAAEGILLAAERYNDEAPVNLGSGREVTIRELAECIVELCGFDGEIRFDPSRPEGQRRRCVDVSRAWKGFGFRAATALEDGLRETIAWYESVRRTAAGAKAKRHGCQ